MVLSSFYSVYIDESYHRMVFGFMITSQGFMISRRRIFFLKGPMDQIYLCCWQSWI